MATTTSDLLDLPIELKIGQMFFVGIPGPEIDTRTKDLIKSIQPGGVCLFARNIRELEQTRVLLDDLRTASDIEPFLSLDQEGGLVDRLRRVLAPMPAANRIKTRAEAATFGRIVGNALRILGFNMDFAPVIDVVTPQRHSSTNGIYSRAFGDSAEETAALAGNFLEEMAERGILGCLKHFPGLGASRVDSHEELPEVSITPEDWRSTDLLPYRRLLNGRAEPAVMVAHAAYPGFDLQESDRSGKLLPSSLSYNFVTKLLRQELGFEGVTITDDLEMGAIVGNYGIGDACKMAVLAGEDMLAICSDADAIREGYTAVLDAVREGVINEDLIDRSVSRIEALKERISEPLPFDRALLSQLSEEIDKFTASLA